MRPREKYSVFWLIFSLVFQIAFAEGVLLIIRHFMAEDPAALRAFPYVAWGLRIFWSFFIIRNLRQYIAGWKAYNARKRLEAAADAPRSPEERAAAQQAREEARELQRQREAYQRQIDEKARRDIAEQRRQAAQQAKFCIHCAARIPADSTFCPVCGRPQ